MQDARHHASKTNFQLERFSFFSDGVFAIAITLLAIEIKIPVLASHTDRELAEHFPELALKFLGFLISFGIIGHYWSVHLKIIGYLRQATQTVIWLNLLFLFSIVLLPFSSGLLGENSSNMRMHIPYTIYVGNILFTSFTNWLLWRYISNPKYQLLTHAISKSRIRLGMYRTLTVPAVFLVSLLLSFLLPMAARLIPLTIPLILNIGLRAMEKKADGEENSAADAEPGPAPEATIIVIPEETKPPIEPIDRTVITTVTS